MGRDMFRYIVAMLVVIMTGCGDLPKRTGYVSEVERSGQILTIQDPETSVTYKVRLANVATERPCGKNDRLKAGGQRTLPELAQLLVETRLKNRHVDIFFRKNQPEQAEFEEVYVWYANDNPADKTPDDKRKKVNCINLNLIERGLGVYEVGTGEAEMSEKYFSYKQKVAMKRQQGLWEDKQFLLSWEKDLKARKAQTGSTARRTPMLFSSDQSFEEYQETKDAAAAAAAKMEAADKEEARLREIERIRQEQKKRRTLSGNE